MQIERVENGYIVIGNHSKKSVYKTLEEVFKHALQHFEGRCEGFGGDSYGKVTISRKRDE